MPLKDQPTLIFDGDCGFCTTSASWIQKWMPDDVEVQPWQALDLDEVGLTVDDVSSAAYFASADGGLHRGHLAVGQALRHAGFPLCIAGELMIRPPIAWLAAPVYRLVATYRYKLPGSTDACKLN